MQVVLAFPPTVGFGTSVTLCGMAFGSARDAHDLHWDVQLKLIFWASVKRDPRFRAVQAAVHKSGVWVAVLIRFCPVPFCYANLIFALLDAVTLRDYVAASIITSPRLLVHVFVGAKMYELMDRDVRRMMDPTARALSAVSLVRIITD
ncbi:Tlg2-vesicle protein [Malassezia cuniculi]|uniref:Golgi apparatus membrane protein TVP38 n=1 Tax=Malassezia cuniculi TaxID=948313 RepID=A0AAF0ERB0_9BASI|nr:Tlg2-vesicle protein [Malassezia cuniculi]